MVREIRSKEEFDAVINGEEVALIDFYAHWCGPCKQISPKFEEHEQKVASAGVKFYKVNIDDVSEVAEQMSIRSIPTFHAYKNGSRIGETVGANAGKLEAFVQQGIENV